MCLFLSRNGKYDQSRVDEGERVAQEESSGVGQITKLFVGLFKDFGFCCE